MYIRVSQNIGFTLDQNQSRPGFSIMLLGLRKHILVQILRWVVLVGAAPYIIWYLVHHLNTINSCWMDCFRPSSPQHAQSLIYHDSISKYAWAITVWDSLGMADSVPYFQMVTLFLHLKTFNFRTVSSHNTIHVCQ